LGDDDRALREARRGAELAERFGFENLQRTAQGLVLNALVSCGDYEAAQQVLAELRARGEAGIFATIYEARLHLGLGDTGRAVTDASAAIQGAVHDGNELAEVLARITRARACLRGRGAALRAEVEDDLARITELIDTYGYELHRPTLHEARAELARVLGDEAGHARELREAHRLYVAMGADGHVQRLATELAS
jgi:hypothetical protein